MTNPDAAPALNPFQTAASTVKGRYLLERDEAVTRGADADRLRHLDLRLLTCDEFIGSLAHAVGKESATEIVRHGRVYVEGITLPDERDKSARVEPCLLIRDAIAAL